MSSTDDFGREIRPRIVLRTRQTWYKQTVNFYQLINFCLDPIITSLVLEGWDWILLIYNYIIHDALEGRTNIIGQFEVAKILAGY